MTDSKKRPLTDAELWKKIEDSAAEDEMDRIIALSPAELDAEIRADGGDPDAIGTRGAAFVKELLARQERLRWQDEARAGLAAVQKLADESRLKEKLPRAELLKRIQAARNDPRFTSPVSVMFRNKTAEASTDEELQSLLEDIELLAKLVDADK